jgi:hypothetical protein
VRWVKLKSTKLTVTTVDEGDEVDDTKEGNEAVVNLSQDASPLLMIKIFVDDDLIGAQTCIHSSETQSFGIL